MTGHRSAYGIELERHKFGENARSPFLPAVSSGSSLLLRLPVSSWMFREARLRGSDNATSD
ncbi:hypothetical protein GFS60_05115 [Rhodococcus sp. WAY2]|nr:hypothetical protein GFS60_05115 [Rhodococcus sp. WAY2]